MAGAQVIITDGIVCMDNASSSIYIFARIYKFFILSLVSISLFCSGCAKKQISQMIVAGKLSSDKFSCVYVALPRDGTFGSIVYNGSGAKVASSLCLAFSEKSVQCKMAVSTLPFDRNLQMAKDVGCNYVVIPKILHWEDRNTPWSGKLDRASVQVDVYEVDQKRLISSSLIEATNQWATFIDNPPEVLLPAPFKKIVDSLY